MWWSRRRGRGAGAALLQQAAGEVDEVVADAAHGGDELFGYYEYVGPPSEYEARMRRLAEAPRMREWWDLMEAMQIPHPRRQPGAWWTTMDEVFHQD